MSTHQLKPIRTDAEHSASLKRIDDLLHASPGTPEADERSTGIWIRCVLTNAMEHLGYTQTDLSELLGSRSHASEILTGRRPAVVGSNPQDRERLESADRPARGRAPGPSRLRRRMGHHFNRVERAPTRGRRARE
jgi:antitoxin component HigA of HigAB toxin-antitoxin module